MEVISVLIFVAFGRVSSAGFYRRVIRRKHDVLEEHIASIFRVEYDPPKHGDFSEQDDVTNQKIVVFIVTTVRASNPARNTCHVPITANE
jgi:hypothetical protein